MRKYGTNSAYAVMRLLTMANVVNRSIGEKQMRLIRDIALAQELTQDDILRIVAEHEIDVAQANDDGPFFNGDPMLPRKLVINALDEIQGAEMQLQISQVMHGLLISENAPKKDEVIFVEHAVGHWGIGDTWRSWLQNQPSTSPS